MQAYIELSKTQCHIQAVKYTDTIQLIKDPIYTFVSLEGAYSPYS